jgi:hypothetical protein
MLYIYFKNITKRFEVIFPDSKGSGVVFPESKGFGDEFPDSKGVVLPDSLKVLLSRS